ncbi:MAG: SDR family oxidoreductase [Candidatus Gastranaerophilales bacterium]|nr:SDR family oxidoreductase [Candidatus Gastranaerophilales bacterium]
MKKTIFVLGAGRGCGNSVAKKFAENDFRVVLMSRNENHLAEYEKEFTEKGIEVYTKVFDASNFDSITKSLNELKEKFGAPDVLFYNVGVTTIDSKIKGDKDVNLLLNRYMVDVTGAYHSIQQILDEEFKKKNGAILVTGGGLALNPMYDYLPLSMDKAALRAMCIALHNELKKQNVFVGVVTVTGAIIPDDPDNLTKLANAFWKLYTERKDCEIIH